MKILVIEDDKDLCLSIAKGLKVNGYAVDTAFDGEEGFSFATCENYDLIILDLNLPGIDGLEILKELRMKNKESRVIVLTARGQIVDKIRGLDLGANDYMTKPFHFAELEARIRCLLRQEIIMNDVVISCAELSFDTASRRCYVENTEIKLTKREAGLLEYLLRRKESYISQEELMEHVWDSSVDCFSNAVRVHISSLRKKLRVALGYDPIQNKINVGYIITEGIDCNDE